MSAMKKPVGCISNPTYRAWSFLCRTALVFAVICTMLPGVIPGTHSALAAYAQDLDVERTWSFTYFGPSTGEKTNQLISSGAGIEGAVSIRSATFNEDGTINKKGGKFVADSPADGASYYYTEIDPSKENFVLQADVTVDQVNPNPDGQEGFALMARDAIWTDHSTGSNMANLVSVTGTKLPTGGINAGSEIKDTTGFRAYSGIVNPEASEENSIEVIRYGWWKDKEGNPVKITQGDCYRLRLEKTSNAYIGTQYAIKDNGETGEVIGTYTWYIPAIDRNATEVGSYEELDDPLSVQDMNKAYIALVAARGMNVTFSNISFVTSEWKASEWKPQEDVLVDPVYSIISPETSGEGTYELVFRANADGTAEVSRGGQVVDSNVRISANTPWSKVYDLTGTQTDFSVTFTPDQDYRVSSFEKLSDYSTQTVPITVLRREIGSDQGIIFVKTDGQPSNSGASMDDAVDITTALSFARPGQRILLNSETYTFTDGPLSIVRGRNGREDAHIVMTTYDNGFATFDFEHKGEGLKCGGNYWEFSNINVKNSANGCAGMYLSGSHNILKHMNFYNNGNTGLQISGSSYDDRSLWPSYNSVINCTAMNNADKALADADGFACKLTAGDGNTFDGCISAYNADDGWDLFAKITPGSIGPVQIRNCVAYKNGYIKVKEGGTAKDFELADIQSDDSGSLTFGDGVELEAGNGNGFKMGGSNMPGSHRLTDSISYENKAKGIDSNSGPDIIVTRCVSYNNGDSNVALYTNNKGAITAYVANHVISYRKEAHTEVSDSIRLQGQDEGAIREETNFFWDADRQCSSNSSGDTVQDDWFYSLDTTLVPAWGKNGTVNMHGLLCLKDAPSAEDGWQQAEDGSWCFLVDGERVTGWLWDADGRWYHFSDDGTMDSGWLKDSDGSWYYLSQAHDGSFGSLVSGWLHDAGFWYYLSEAHDGSFGRMLTGWVRVGGFWYYLYPQAGAPQGSCALDTVIDGYRVDASGRWVA